MLVGSHLYFMFLLVFNFLDCPFEEKYTYENFVSSIHLLITKCIPNSRQNFVSAFLLCHCHIGYFPMCPPFIGAGKIRVNLHVISGFRNYFQEHRRLPEPYFLVRGGFCVTQQALCVPALISRLS
jgi:hypothetical protein